MSDSVESGLIVEQRLAVFKMGRLISTGRYGVDDLADHWAIGKKGCAKRRVVGFAAVPNDFNACFPGLIKIEALKFLCRWK